MLSYRAWWFLWSFLNPWISQAELMLEGEGEDKL
jgi:hypothetical protein